MKVPRHGVFIKRGDFLKGKGSLMLLNNLCGTILINIANGVCFGECIFQIPKFIAKRLLKVQFYWEYGGYPTILGVPFYKLKDHFEEELVLISLFPQNGQLKYLCFDADYGKIPILTFFIKGRS